MQRAVKISPQKSRKRIMKKIVDFDTRVYEKTNIMLCDLAPRNVIFRETKKPTHPLVFIDFGNAVFNSKRDDLIVRYDEVFLG